MTESQRQLAWNLFVEARKEILEYQRIRTQIIGFKITFVSAGIGLTILAIMLAIYALLVPLAALSGLSAAAILLLIMLLIYDIRKYRVPSGYFTAEEDGGERPGESTSILS
ncbi:MAG TPA: hypothetical protein VGV59_20850 [Pyrinomonadaceae bacterium]|nr:hypothetical protein [Pyrinomonadaceae bacterium]